MSTIEIRQSIIDNLLQIDDILFLSEVKKMVESKATDKIYQLNNYQKERIESARLGLANGQTIHHEVLKNEISKWLNSK